MRVAVTVLEVPWRAPLVASHGAGSGAGRRAGAGSRTLLLLTLAGDDGVSGYGEAAPLAGYDGVSIEAVTAALTRCEPVLAESDGVARERLLAECSKLAQLPEALAAIDLALWDLAGRRAGEPVWRLLGADRPPVVAVNATIGAEQPAEAGEEAAAARASGFGCVKVKVGTGDDERRLAAVRAAVGSEMLIRIDANGAWAVADAIDALGRLRVHRLELCEEPVHGLDQLATVAAAVGMPPVAADESASDPEVFTAPRRFDAVCLKISRCGGITGVLRDAAAARGAGYEVYLASTLDGPLGIAAALHAAAALAPDRHCGLATLGRFDAPDPLPVSGGWMSPPQGSGLGDGLVDWYAAR